MNVRTVATLALALVSLLPLVGCGSNGTQSYTSEEAKAQAAAKAMTPQQQLEAAEKSALPADQKAALIKSIKDKNGLQ